MPVNIVECSYPIVVDEGPREFRYMTIEGL